MKKLLRKLRLWLLPPISKKKAVQIARNSDLPSPSAYQVVDTMPDNVRIYEVPVEPCWCVYAPWGDENDGELRLRSSRIILVSKLSGEVLYDGSANDEG